SISQADVTLPGDGAAVTKHAIGRDTAQQQAPRFSQAHRVLAVGVRSQMQTVVFSKCLAIVLWGTAGFGVPVAPGVLVGAGRPGRRVEGAPREGFFAACHRLRTCSVEKSAQE